MKTKVKRKSKISAKMLETLKKINKQAYPTIINHQTCRLTKRGYLSYGYLTKKSEELLKK